jgi:hypothetical protein
MAASIKSEEREWVLLFLCGILLLDTPGRLWGGIKLPRPIFIYRDFSRYAPRLLMADQ